MSRSQVARRLGKSAHLFGTTVEFDRVPRPQELPDSYWLDLAAADEDGTLIQLAGLLGPLGRGFSDPLDDWRTLAADCRAILHACDLQTLGPVATRLVATGDVVLIPSGAGAFHIGGAGKRGTVLAMALDTAARFPVFTPCNHCGRVIANTGKVPRTYCGAACRKAAHFAKGQP